MTGARIRLLVAAGLFAGWLGWLAYLATYKTHPIVVSRSQVMASSNFVVAEVRLDPETGEPAREVRVIDDLRPLGESLKGREIRVANLKDARIAGGNGFQGGTEYLLPLTRRADADFRLTPPPRAPGPGGDLAAATRPWAYRWADPEVQRQFNGLVPQR